MGVRDSNQKKIFGPCYYRSKIKIQVSNLYWDILKQKKNYETDFLKLSPQFEVKLIWQRNVT